MQMRWMRRNKFRVGRNFFGWAVENGTVYVAGGRLDSGSLRCSADVRCLQAERLVRGCESPCDALNSTAAADDDDDAARRTPWRLVGRLPAPMCVFAHCVATLPVASVDQPSVAPSASGASAATSRAHSPAQAQSRSTQRC